jgi:hypothetical protein
MILRKQLFIIGGGDFMETGREKEIVSRSVDKWVKATTKDYSKWLEGSPSYVTYYQLNTDATKQDSALENVHSLTGTSTPNKYNKIEDVALYGVDALDIQNEIADQGMKSSVNGDFIMLPETIRPYAGDFFVFDYDGLRDHMFKVDDVQFDKASAEKYFKCSFSLYQEESSSILGNVEKEFTMQYNNIGTESKTVIEKTTDVMATKAKAVVDRLIDDYASNYYDEEMDKFLYKDDVGYWSPYLERFLNQNSIMKKYDRKIMEDFYADDYFGVARSKIYNEESYRDSIFQKITDADPNLVLDNTFMCKTEYDLKKDRSMPFFHTGDGYRLVTVLDRKYSNGLEEYAGAFDFMFEKPSDTLLSKMAASSYKIVTSDADLEKKQELILPGDIIYLVDKSNNFIIKKVARAVTKTDSTGDYLDLQDVGAQTLMSTEVSDVALGIVKQYLAGSLSLSESNLLAITKYYFAKSFRNYILEAFVIFALKQGISGFYK